MNHVTPNLHPALTALRVFLTATSCCRTCSGKSFKINFFKKELLFLPLCLANLLKNISLLATATPLSSPGEMKLIFRSAPFLTRSTLKVLKPRPLAISKPVFATRCSSFRFVEASIQLSGMVSSKSYPTYSPLALSNQACPTSPCSPGNAAVEMEA
jgi:hypothetical protein